MAEYRHFGRPDKQWVDFPKQLPAGTKIVGVSRDRLSIRAEPCLAIQESDVKARDGHQVRIRTYRRSDIRTRPALFVYMHGGDSVTGSFKTDDWYCRLLAREINIVVLSVECRLAPENKFPTGWQDSQDALRWAASEAGRTGLDVDLNKAFILGGTSAGANFTAGLAHFALEEELRPSLPGLVFLAGSLCHPDARPEQYRDQILSVDEIDIAPGLSKRSIDYFAGKSVGFRYTIASLDGGSHPSPMNQSCPQA